MSTNTLTTSLISTGSTVEPSHVTQYYTALNGDIVPRSSGVATNDGGSLGDTTNKWADLFLASGSVINFDSGDMTITHASNQLSISGGKVGIGTSSMTRPSILHLNPTANSEAIKIGADGGLGLWNGGYPYFASNAYTDGVSNEFKNIEASASIGMCVISPMRESGSLTIGGVFTRPGNSSADTAFNISTFNTAISWDTSGNVGIGSNPDSSFSLSVNGTNALSVGQKAVDNTEALGILDIKMGNSIEAGSDDDPTGHPSFGLKFTRWWSGTTENDLAGIYAYGSSAWGGNLVFRTKDADGLTASSARDVMYLTENGYLGIGTVPQEMLDVNGALSIVDGMTEPSTHSGKASIYVDSADGDLKVKFGDGTVKTLATDT